MTAAVIRLAQLMSVTVITVIGRTYHGGMVRWEPNAQGRLGQAALELFVERGFEQVTVAEIAERAGLTERTFFRYYADKREVLFAGGEGFQDLFVSTVGGAPDSAAPIDAVAGALYAAAAMFAAHSGGVRRRAAIIAAHSDLRERELIKLATVAAAVADALRRRGVADPAASLTAEAGLAVFRIAFARWISEPEGPDLAQLISESLDELRAVAAGK
jgi:AcrR family transcriptional regulator